MLGAAVGLAQRAQRPLAGVAAKEFLSAARAWGETDASGCARPCAARASFAASDDSSKHVLALGGRKLLELMIVLKNFLPLLGRELPEVRVGLVQLVHFASRGQCEAAPAGAAERTVSVTGQPGDSSS
jgi:hypothetical protein